MRIICLLSAFLLLFISASAQSTTGKIPLSISFYAPYSFNPGMRLGSRIHLKEWGEQSNRNIFIAPQVGVFSRIGAHTSFMVSTDVGFQMGHKKKNRFSGFSIGLGYIGQSDIISTTVNLGSGETTKNRELTHFFVPTFNYEFGKQISPLLYLFIKPAIGMKISGTTENELFAALEAGATFSIGRKGKTTQSP